MIYRDVGDTKCHGENVSHEIRGAPMINFPNSLSSYGLFFKPIILLKLRNLQNTKFRDQIHRTSLEF